MKRWIEPKGDAAVAEQISLAANIPFSVAMVLAGRGLADAETVDAFLYPRLSSLGDPFTLPDMKEAVSRIRNAITTGEHIVVYGDYDVDGITSTALLQTVLKELGGNVSAFLPHRVDDGYGLSIDALQKCMTDGKPDLVVTVDCGTNSVEAVAWAKEQGMDVVVTDHHEAAEQIADAVAVVNPKRGNDEDARRLAGVGVAFKLCHALVKAGRAVDDTGASEMDLRGYLDWVALGTICDMVPLQGENRVLARHGLGAVEARRTAGLRALMEVANVRGEVTGYHLGFLLGPRLNASGRLGDAQVALDLLLTANEAEAGEWAQALDVANRERQRLEKETVTEAREMIDETFDAGRDYGLVSAAEGWHPGVVGIVASRLTRHYRRPNVVIAMSEEGCGKGSCRSIDQLNLVEALQACDDLLEKWGGHAMAAGLEVRKEYVEAFRERFNNVCRKRLADEDLRPMEQIDAWVDLGHLDRAFYDAQQLLRPFGMENPQPVWAARNVRVIGKPRVMAEKHIRMTVTAGGREIDAVGFGMADREIPDGPLDIAFRLKLNVFRGRENLELHLRDFRASE